MMKWMTLSFWMVATAAADTTDGPVTFAPTSERTNSSTMSPLIEDTNSTTATAVQGWWPNSHPGYEIGYAQAGQLSIRRSGWSWPHPDYLKQYGPFCSRDDTACVGAEAACRKLGGTSIKDSFCFFPEKKYNVIGINYEIPETPCFDGRVNGETFGDNGQFCIVESSYTIIGPVEGFYENNEVKWCRELNGISSLSYNNYYAYCALQGFYTVVGPTYWVTWTQSRWFGNETDAACSELGGKLIEGGPDYSNNDFFCVLEGIYSVIGPTCWNDTCFTEDTKAACAGLGGTNIGDTFCILQEEYSVVGPTCYGDTCYTEDTAAACSALEGVSIGDTFCVLKGKYAAVGPVCWKNTCYTAETTAVCNANGGTLIGNFCILKGDHAVVGPTCYDENDGNDCRPDETKAACQTAGGVNFADRFCVLPTVAPPPSASFSMSPWTSILLVVYSIVWLFF